MIDPHYVLDSHQGHQLRVAIGGQRSWTMRSLRGRSATLPSDPPHWFGQVPPSLDVLAAETERTNRMGRSFAVLLLDLDGLKKNKRQRTGTSWLAERTQSPAHISHPMPRHWTPLRALWRRRI